MRLWLWFLLCPALPAGATECLGPKRAKAYVIYLHGLAPAKQKKNEDGGNLKVLERLAKDFSLRIAIPRGSVCPQNQLCWPARDKSLVLTTFRSVREQAQTCWSGQPKYTVIGFSNGGYFAFKLYKTHQDPLLARIIAVGAAGSWDENADKANPYSSLSMLMGNQDMTLKDTKRLVDKVKKKVPGILFETFQGGHQLDYGALSSVLKKKKI